MSAEKNKRYATRVRDLIKEGYGVAALEKVKYSMLGIWDGDRAALQAWVAKVDNIVEVIFGTKNSYYKRFKSVRGLVISSSRDIYDIAGFLSGVLDDLENDYLKNNELLMAGEIFENVLDQAKHLNKAGFKDPAAVLGRVVLEDALKRIAGEAGVDASKRASQLNDELRKIGWYQQPQWRVIQAWLDLGNAAAHGEFENYTADDVWAMIEGLDRFVAIELRKE